MKQTAWVPVVEGNNQSGSLTFGLDVSVDILPFPRWGIMWGMAVVIYAGCKWLTWINRLPTSAPPWKHIAYLLGWPGMDVDTFLCGRPERVQVPDLSEWTFASAKLVLGTSLLGLAGSVPFKSSPFLVAWTGMIGIVFTLHFGLFHLLSCFWRSKGIPATPIMNWPLASRNLSDFWGRRWNLAFRDLTSRFLFRPLQPTLGPAGALLASFLISGLVHDLVISVPAGGGWGLPTCYFLIQGCGILLEHSKYGRKMGLNRGLVGRVYCFSVVVLPCPLLFHTAFRQSVIVPFLQALEFVK